MEFYEHLFMFLFTAITNLWSIPSLYLVYKRNRPFLLQAGIFTFVTSFMYHASESLDVELLFLTRIGWHKLDNIGSILCLILLIVHLMDNIDKDELGRYISVNECRKDRFLGYLGLWITLILQTKHP